MSLFKKPSRSLSKDGSSLPYHDGDEKYGKKPLEHRSSRRRLRYRHVVAVACVFVLVWLYGPSWSSSLTDRNTTANMVKDQIEKVASPAGGGINNKPGVVVGGNGNQGPAGGAAATPIAVADSGTGPSPPTPSPPKKKKKKEKPPPTLFEFEGKAIKDTRFSFFDRKKSAVSNTPQGRGKSTTNKNKKKPTNKKSALKKKPATRPTETTTRFGGGEQLWIDRQKLIKEAFQQSWNAYKRDAWGKDEYHPVARFGTNLITNGQGNMIVDNLDTLLLMDLTEDYKQARDWVVDQLNFDQDDEVNVFETTIRVLGGLLSAYDQSRDSELLSKAVDLADRLMGAFESPSGIPFARVHLREKRGVPSHDQGGVSATAEVTSLQLEFKYLSFLTNNDKYWKAVENVMFRIRDHKTLDDLVPNSINPVTGRFFGTEISLGSRGDNYYEYLAKQHIQTMGTEPMYKEMYTNALRGIRKHLVDYSYPHKLVFVGDTDRYNPGSLNPRMEQLACVFGGTFALGATGGLSLTELNNRSDKAISRIEVDDFKLGTDLTESCYEMYRQTPTKLAPEVVHWFKNEYSAKSEEGFGGGTDFAIYEGEAHYSLRPETIESLFYMYRFTGDIKYRQWGWNIFQAIEKYCKVATGGYSSVDNVRVAGRVRKLDKMESYFLSGTLKYFYLLFGGEDVLPLEKYVFNTEGHPLPVFTPPAHMLIRSNPEMDALEEQDGEFNDENEEGIEYEEGDDVDYGLDGTTVEGDDDPGMFYPDGIEWVDNIIEDDGNYEGIEIEAEENEEEEEEDEDEEAEDGEEGQDPHHAINNGNVSPDQDGLENVNLDEVLGPDGLPLNGVNGHLKKQQSNADAVAELDEVPVVNVEEGEGDVLEINPTEDVNAVKGPNVVWEETDENGGGEDHGLM